MSLDVPKNDQFEKFVRFAQVQLKAKHSTAIARAGGEDPQKEGFAAASISAAKGDTVAPFWWRSQHNKDENNSTRKLFREAVVTMFGGSMNNVPENVKTAMKLNDYKGDKGKPLTARRILMVQKAIAAATAPTPQEFVRKVVGGDGEVAQMARGLLERKLEGETKDPREVIFGEAARNTKVLLLRSVLKDLKDIAKGKDGMFASVDYNRCTVELKGIGPVSRFDSTVACDQFARFVTGRADAKYRKLSASEKKKADLVMAMAAQSSQNALVNGISAMMHRKGTGIGFFPVAQGGGDQQVWKVNIEFADNGDLKVSLGADFKVKTVIHDDNCATMCNPGSKVKYSAEYTFTAKELERISQTDFKNFSSIELDKRIMLEKPDNMYEGAINLIAKPYRLDVDLKIDMVSEFY